MISRNLARRLELLEASLAPPGEPQFMTVNFVSGDGEIVNSVTYQLGQVRQSKRGAARFASRSRAPSVFPDRSR